MSEPRREDETEPLPPRPEAPLPGDCCGGGCAACVLDVYESELVRWQQQVRDILDRRERARAQGAPPDA